MNIRLIIYSIKIIFWRKRFARLIKQVENMPPWQMLHILETRTNKPRTFIHDALVTQQHGGLKTWKKLLKS